MSCQRLLTAKDLPKPTLLNIYAHMSKYSTFAGTGVKIELNRTFGR